MALILTQRQGEIKRAENGWRAEIQTIQGLSFAWVQNLKTESFSSLNFRFFPFLVAKNMEIDFSLVTFPICCFIFSPLLSQSLISQ